jgi:hypothetical protein
MGVCGNIGGRLFGARFGGIYIKVIKRFSDLKTQARLASQARMALINNIESWSPNLMRKKPY